ncbi:unnamed protein product [Dracunculus medinensis]|uniref:Uncharacterized protein n=1 Tax=Dracunculus medinensis TaxID=318479 RepID=A0A0N4UDR4_DRAME|nr:unnamed protein product [Dracunculus medinensis]
MLANYFFDQGSISKLQTFFINVHHLAIVCDPPFGVFMDALMQTIKNLKEKFLATGG